MAVRAQPGHVRPGPNLATVVALRVRETINLLPNNWLGRQDSEAKQTSN